MLVVHSAIPSKSELMADLVEFNPVNDVQTITPCCKAGHIAVVV